MEGVWIGSMLLSLHVGPLEIRRTEGLTQARCLWLQGKLCVTEESTALSQTGLTDVILYIYINVFTVCLPAWNLISTRLGL